MHSMHVGNYAIFHNGDFSGGVRILVPIEDVDASNEVADVEIPFEVLKTIVAKYVASEAISVLEDADPDEVLGTTHNAVEFRQDPVDPTTFRRYINGRRA